MSRIHRAAEVGFSLGVRGLQGQDNAEQYRNTRDQLSFSETPTDHATCLSEVPFAFCGLKKRNHPRDIGLKSSGKSTTPTIPRLKNR